MVRYGKLQYRSYVMYFEFYMRDKRYSLNSRRDVVEIPNDEVIDDLWCMISRQDYEAAYDYVLHLVDRHRRNKVTHVFFVAGIYEVCLIPWLNIEVNIEVRNILSHQYYDPRYIIWKKDDFFFEPSF